MNEELLTLNPSFMFSRKEKPQNKTKKGCFDLFDAMFRKTSQ